MPGSESIEAARTMQERQRDLLAAIYATPESETAAVAALNRDYDETVDRLKATLGADAPVGMVDVDLASLFSDLHKDDAGFRPRGYGYADATAWMKARRDAAAA